jgi:hypothetical protein
MTSRWHVKRISADPAGQLLGVGANFWGRPFHAAGLRPAVAQDGGRNLYPTPGSFKKYFGCAGSGSIL